MENELIYAKMVEMLSELNAKIDRVETAVMRASIVDEEQTDEIIEAVEELQETEKEEQEEQKEQDEPEKTEELQTVIIQEAPPIETVEPEKEERPKKRKFI